MQIHVFTLIAAVLFASATGSAAQKAVIVTYPPDTPESVLEQAMSSIRETGGMVTHEYSSFRVFVVLHSSLLTVAELLKGFAAKASSKTLDIIRTLETNFLPLIEEDSIVSVDGDIVE